MPDFGLLQTPNFAASALAGYNAGRQVGQHKRLDTALAGVDFARPETILPVLQADPSTGAVLLGASQKAADAHRQAAASAATGAWLIKAMGGGDQSSGGASAPATTQGAPTSPAIGSPTDASGNIVVTAPKPAVSPSPAPAGLSDEERAAINADPEQYLKLKGGLDKLGKDHLDHFKAQIDLQGQLLGSATDQASYTNALNQARTAGIDVSSAPTQYDPAWVAQMAQATMTAKEHLDYQLAARAADRADAGQAETMRHNRVDEGQGASRVGFEAANVGIARGHLALDQQAGARAAASAGAKPTATAPAAHYEYRVVNGVTQRRLVK